MPEPNHYQRRTSPRKLRGEYYTPPELVELIISSFGTVKANDLILDPACGDGSFLAGAAARLAGLRLSPEEIAKRLVGFEINPDAAALARERIAGTIERSCDAGISPAKIQVVVGDSLEYPKLGSLLRAAGVAPPTGRLLVVGNPPYVEAKRLSQAVKKSLKAHYPDATPGAPDLYLYFLHAALGWLRKGDSLAFVLPNKFLIAKSAFNIRNHLIERRRLRDLWFATHLDLFPGTSVYPIVLFAEAIEQNPERDSVGLSWLGNDEGSLEIVNSLSVPYETFEKTQSRCLFPVPARPALRSALDRMLASPTRLGDLLDIRWTVSFHRAGLRERYVTDHPLGRYAKRFLGGGPFAGNGEVTRYRIAWAGHWILYGQEELRRLGNPLPDPELFTRPKIVICQNGRTLRAAYDDAGFVLKDTLLAGLLRDEVDHPLIRHPQALVGLLCSRTVHFFCSHVFFGGHVGGGYLHFLRSFLIDLPIGQWSEEAARAVAAEVSALATDLPAEERALREERIERYVSGSFGLTPEEDEGVGFWAKSDRNWQARDRVRPPRRVRVTAT